MALPDINEVRYALSSLVENFASFLLFVSTEKSPEFSDYLNRLHSIIMELIRISRELQLLTTTNERKYKKPFEEVWKIQFKLMIDVHQLEDKYLDKSFFSWERVIREGKMRNDLVNFYKDISRKLKKIQKNI